MNRIFVPVLFILIISGPALANEQFALVCDWEGSFLFRGTRTLGVGESTFVFKEREKELQLIDLNGIACSNLISIETTETEIFMRCEILYSTGKVINTITIDRFSGDFSSVETNSFGKMGNTLHGTCTKRTKRF